MNIKSDTTLGLSIAIGLLSIFLLGTWVVSLINGPVRPQVHICSALDVHVETEHERQEMERYREEREVERYDRGKMDRQEAEKFERERMS